MAASRLRFKVFNSSGEYVAACKYAEDAAAVVGVYGKGAEIRLGRSSNSMLYVEGWELCRAADSVDEVAEICRLRIIAKRENCLVSDVVKREQAEVAAEPPRKSHAGLEW